MCPHGGCGSRGGVVVGGFCLVGGLDPSGLAGARPVCDGVQRVFGCGKLRALGCTVFMSGKTACVGVHGFGCVLA